MIEAKSMVCACGKTARYVENLRFNSYKLDGWKCPSCGEVYYNPDKEQKILLLNKLRKQKFRMKLNQVRSNLIIRIPKEVGDALNLHKDEEVEFSIDGNDKIMIVKA
jgi:hypothetical protein